MHYFEGGREKKKSEHYAPERDHFQVCQIWSTLTYIDSHFSVKTSIWRRVCIDNRAPKPTLKISLTLFEDIFISFDYGTPYIYYSSIKISYIMRYRSIFNKKSNKFYKIGLVYLIKYIWYLINFIRS